MHHTACFSFPKSSTVWAACSSFGVTSLNSPVAKSKTNPRIVTSEGIQGCDLSFSTCFCVAWLTSEYQWNLSGDTAHTPHWVMDVVLELFFGKHFHAATGVADDHDFLHAQNMNRKHERTHNVFRCRRSDVPDNIRIGTGLMSSHLSKSFRRGSIQVRIATFGAGLFASEGS